MMNPATSFRPAGRLRPLMSLLGILGIAVVATGCSPVLINKDGSAPIAQYKTYRWVEQPQVSVLNLQNPKVDYLTGLTKIVRNQEVDQRLRPVLDQRLARDGYQITSSDNPDFYVSYFGKAKDRDWVSTWTGNTQTVNNVPVIIFPNYGTLQSAAFRYQEGTVYLVLYDAHTKAPAWTGSINRSDFGPDFTGPQTATAVDELVDQFHSAG